MWCYMILDLMILLCSYKISFSFLVVFWLLQRLLGYVYGGCIQESFAVFEIYSESCFEEIVKHKNISWHLESFGVSHMGKDLSSFILKYFWSTLWRICQEKNKYIFFAFFAWHFGTFVHVRECVLNMHGKLTINRVYYKSLSLNILEICLTSLWIYLELLSLDILIVLCDSFSSHIHLLILILHLLYYH